MNNIANVSLASLLLLLVGCSGGGNNDMSPQPSVPQPMGPQVLVPQATATAMPEIVLKSGGIDGLDNQFSPVDGDSSTGGQGGSIDGIACAPSMYNTYHVHAFVGLLVNGKEIALPDAIGLYQPGAEINGVTDTAKCYYPIHTHDATGMVHIESSSSAPLSSAIYTLGNVLDIWGMPLSSTGFGPYSGTVRVFYATTPLRNLYSGTYYQYTGSVPKGIKLYSHEAIWIQVGASYVPASQLPKIRFYTEY
jgi:hypothetical protein